MGTGLDDAKCCRALELIDTADFGASAQVIQEFYFTVIRKAARPLSPEQALEWIEQWINEALGATTVYSEDLKSDQRYGQARVVNPFCR